MQRKRPSGGGEDTLHPLLASMVIVYGARMHTAPHTCLHSASLYGAGQDSPGLSWWRSALESFSHACNAAGTLQVSIVRARTLCHHHILGTAGPRTPIVTEAMLQKATLILKLRDTVKQARHQRTITAMPTAGKLDSAPAVQIQQDAVELLGIIV